jgi:hypothetical protein
MVAKVSQGSVPPPFLISIVKERDANVKRNMISKKAFAVSQKALIIFNDYLFRIIF